MGKTVSIVQSSYIPWKGYFDLINLADEFVLLDDAQYTRRDWRNRNRIKGPNGLHWLTIPVESKGRYHQKIRETRVEPGDWRRKHWQTIRNFYARAAHFGDYSMLFEELYSADEERFLSRINYRFLRAICDLLEIRTPISWSSDFELPEEPTERLVAICRRLGATTYLSGPSARDYLRVEEFERAGIDLAWMDYAGYPEYRQLNPPFEHQVSIIDLILNEGPHAKRYLKSFARAPDAC